MNYPILVAALLTSLAFLAHTFVGVKEALSTRPKDANPTLQRHWMQSMGAFQLVTVDLLLLSALLWYLGWTNVSPLGGWLIKGLMGWFLLWGIAWLLQLLVLTKNKKDYGALSQWLFWLLNAALLYWGS